MKKITKLILSALATLALAAGLSIVAAAPAQAVYLYTPVTECPWLSESAIKATALTPSARVSVTAYNRNGAVLGGRQGYGSVTWQTPWEDVKFKVETNTGGIAGVSRWCGQY
jgi:hypothetical protein